MVPVIVAMLEVISLPDNSVMLLPGPEDGVAGLQLLQLLLQLSHRLTAALKLLDNSLPLCIHPGGVLLEGVHLLGQSFGLAARVGQQLLQLRAAAVLLLLLSCCQCQLMSQVPRMQDYKILTADPHLV